VTDRPDIPVVPLREAAALLDISTRAAEDALRRAGIRSGYPRAAVEWLATHRPGQGARTDLPGCINCGKPGPTDDLCDACASSVAEIP
jgi:hypothetical protein